MPLIENALKGLLYGKDINRPVFVKDFDEINHNLERLVELSMKVQGEKKEVIEREILFMKQGLAGERDVRFELINSSIPMLCLHDIRIEYEGLVAQLDFVIITKKFICVLETKKLNGDIEINKDGDFIRLIKNGYGKVVKKEGMYSPVSQNDRHIRILKNMLIKNGIIKLMPIISYVVIANSKSIINKTYAPKNIQHELKKYDQLTSSLSYEINHRFKDNQQVSEKTMQDISDFLINNNRPIEFDWVGKFELTDKDFVTVPSEKIKSENVIIEPQKLNKNDDIYEALKKYRLETSRAEGVKPYFLFNNEEMDELVAKKPKNVAELMTIRGFGPKKAEKYGEAILQIFKEHR